MRIGRCGNAPALFTMIRIFFFIIFASVFILIFGLIQLLLLRRLNRIWWEKKWIRRAAYSLPVIGVVSMILVGVAEYNRFGWLSAAASPLTVLAVVLEIALMFSLPFSGVFHLIERLLSKRRMAVRPETVVDHRRRMFLQGAAAVVPLVSMGTGLRGIERAYESARVKPMTMRLAGLPQGLNGLRILQLSDLHLGHYVTLRNLEDILEHARTYSPEIVLVTGDVSDDLNELGSALNLIAALSPRLGCYAILGNHEYFRGIQQVRRIYSQSPVPLMVNESVVIKVGNSTLLLGGIDDPVTMHNVAPDFFVRCIETALAPGPSDTFTLLMSHRPDAFPYAAERKIPFTLAGHTHGGQIGFAGRSLLETSFPHSFLWGEYTIDKYRLYTTSGAGHWFPFRLGCPAEAPLIDLRPM